MPKKSKPVNERAEKNKEKQMAFVKEYMIDHNQTQAAIRAGFSVRSARQIAARLMSKDYIREEIARLTEKQSKRLEITADRVIEELGRVAFVDLREAFDENGHLKDIKDIPEDTARALAGVESDELFQGQGKEREQVGFTRKIKVFDKNRALETLARHFKLLTDTVIVKDGDFAQRMEAARKRMKNAKNKK